jgi:predicted nuclease of predicted toxin-antitoxin system
LKFLLDVHIGTTIAHALSTRGHDVVRAGDAHADWSDADLLRFAVEDDRILVTEDRDFSDLIFRRGAFAPVSVLYLRCAPEKQPLMPDRILLVLENVQLEGHMVVVQPAAFRLRPFPNPKD